jgi:hypothetical protein
MILKKEERKYIRRNKEDGDVEERERLGTRNGKG